ncbi:MAG TPA: metallophosphoesterase, partial [Ramlibacter sp.]|nr:metallophosphoesterase [Ramlibacter sp.]
MSRRRRAVLLCAVAVLLLAAWSVGIEPRWVAQRHIDHAVPGWQGPPGLRVAVASDWHFTRRPLWRVMTVERATRIVDEINAARPDVILLPGDLIADRDWQAGAGGSAEEDIAAVLGRLRAPLGVFAVLGNHDWWHHGPRFAAALQRRGIRVLENEAAPLDAGLWVVGIGDHFTGHSRAAQALLKMPRRAQALVFMHDPASLAELPPVQGLVVAGHTHGGQVWLPGIGAP